MATQDRNPAPRARLQAPQRQRLYEQLVQQLLAYIDLSGLEVGERLPSERELAHELQVSRASLRQATVSLEVQGILEVRHGDGIYLRARPDDAGRVVDLLSRRHRLPEILEAREALETHLAGLAALRRSEDDLKALTTALEVMAADIESGGLGLEGDELFHAAVTRSARNAPLAEFMSALASPISETRQSSLNEPGRPEKSLVAHRRIADAIARRDQAGARRAMQRHVRMVADIGVLRWTATPQHPRSGAPASSPLSKR